MFFGFMNRGMLVQIFQRQYWKHFIPSRYRESTGAPAVELVGIVFDIKTTRTAENLGRVSIATIKRSSTYAAVAVKISTLELVPFVRNIRPIANITAKPAIQSNKFLVPWTCDSTVIATTGSKHATTVEMPDVNLSAPFSDHVFIVSSLFTFGTQSSGRSMFPLFACIFWAFFLVLFSRRRRRDSWKGVRFIAPLAAISASACARLLSFFSFLSFRRWRKAS